METENEFNGEYEYEYEEEAADGLDFTPPPPGVTPTEINSPQLVPPGTAPKQHHLTSCMSAKQSGAKDKKQNKTK